MAVNFLYDADRIVYANGGTDVIPASSVVVAGDIIGVALNDIQSGQKGPIGTEGVWGPFPSDFAAAAKVGTRVYYNATDKTITDAASGNAPAGVLATDAAAGTGTVEVWLNVFP